MPNRVAQLRAEIEAVHPGARLKHRGEAGFSMLLPDGREEHRYTTGPWHWRQSSAHEWAEIDTDLEARPDTTWRHGVKSARFDTLLSSTGARRFVPRRWLSDEWVEFGRLEWQRPSGVWAAVPVGVMSRQGNHLRGADSADGRLSVGFHGRGSRTTLMLKRGTWARPLRWAVTLNGLAWQDGTLVSLSDGEQVGFIRPPTWTDASGSIGSHPIPWVYENGFVTLSPSFDGAVFPVQVDPDYSVAAGADDGYAWAMNSSIGTTDTTIAIGNIAGAIHAWFRFANITAAHDQDCTAATLKVVCSFASTNDILSDLYGVDEDDHAAPTSWHTADPCWVHQHALHTAATTAWDFTTNWVLGTTYTSPDFSNILDEIFARAGWATGNDFGLHWDDGGSANSQQFAAYENTTYTEPVLSLTLVAASQDESGAGAISVAFGAAADGVKAAADSVAVGLVVASASDGAKAAAGDAPIGSVFAVAGSGVKAVSGSAATVVEVSAEAEGETGRSGDGETTAEVATAGQGVKGASAAAAATAAFLVESGGQRSTTGVGEAGVALGVEAEGVRASEGIAGASFALTVEAEGARDTAGESSASVLLGVEAVGTTERAGAGASGIVLAVAATGTTTEQAFGAGAITLTVGAEAGGTKDTTGEAAVVSVLTADGLGTTARAGEAAALVMFDPAAEGAKDTACDAVVEVVFGLAAEGAAAEQASGSGAVGVALSVEGEGRKAAQGEGQAALVVSVAADGLPGGAADAAVGFVVGVEAEGRKDGAANLVMALAFGCLATGRKDVIAVVETAVRLATQAEGIRGQSGSVALQIILSVSADGIARPWLFHGSLRSWEPEGPKGGRQPATIRGRESPAVRGRP
jgi:hypothetical protein